jgi:hypothetical protein
MLGGEKIAGKKSRIPQSEGFERVPPLLLELFITPVEPITGPDLKLLCK